MYVKFRFLLTLYLNSLKILMKIQKYLQSANIIVISFRSTKQLIKAFYDSLLKNYQENMLKE